MTSKLYQVPLDNASIRIFKNPENQPKFGAENCAVVSVHLLGLITQAESFALTAQARGGVLLQKLIDFINAKHETTEFSTLGPLPTDEDRVEFGLSYFPGALFNGYATIVLGSRRNGSGHYFIMYRLKSGELYAVDPQTREVHSDIKSYIKSEGLDDGLYVINGKTHRTKEDYSSLFAEHILSDLMSKCRVGGKRRLRKNGKKTKKSRKHHGVRTRRRRY